jgi:CDP-glucose 4,6-dehydratase
MGVNMLEFFRDKSIFVTGHTGFKGAWFCRILQLAGARITGYALEPESGAVYDKIVESEAINSIIGDIRFFDKLNAAFEKAQPEIVFHMAAQPLVIDAYEEPAYTFDTNVQGTVNILECVRLSDCAKSIVVITTDKVYQNVEKSSGYTEADMLGGNEPYSASKACAEIVSDAYFKSFFHSRAVALSTARAGNVIGGGDISKNRILPDCICSAQQGNEIVVRNPNSVRPYQHVLEPLFAYLTIAKKQYENIDLSGAYNVGPEESDCITTAKLADIFCDQWGGKQTWRHIHSINAPHESGLLRLDCAKMCSVFGWHPVWDVYEAVKNTIQWEKAINKADITDKQINGYISAAYS